MSGEFPRAGFWRRFASLIYDSLVVISLSMLTAILYFAAIQVLISTGLIEQTEGQDPAAFIENSPLLDGIRSALFVGVNVIFFSYFWTKSGQTIGMRAWRLRIFSTVEEPVTMTRLITRLVGSLFGLGTLLVLFDVKEKQSLQDRLAKTEVLKLSKEANDHKSW